MNIIDEEETVGNRHMVLAIKALSIYFNLSKWLSPLIKVVFFFI